MKNYRFTKITNFVVLIAICFGLISCSLNTDATRSEEAKILTGACGETAENHDDVVEINGKKYYTTQSNYYALITDTESDEAKNRSTILNEDLYDEIRVKYWNEWINGNYHVEVGTFTVVFYSPNKVTAKETLPGEYIITKEEAIYYTTAPVRSQNISILIQTPIYQKTNGFGTFIKITN